jgi:hypothetical protein
LESWRRGLHGKNTGFPVRRRCGGGWVAQSRPPCCQWARWVSAHPPHAVTANAMVGGVRSRRELCNDVPGVPIRRRGGVQKSGPRSGGVAQRLSGLKPAAVNRCSGAETRPPPRAVTANATMEEVRSRRELCNDVPCVPIRRRGGFQKSGPRSGAGVASVAPTSASRFESAVRQREGRLHGGGLPRSRRVVIERMRRGARLIASSPGERRRQCDAPQCGSVQMVGQGHHHDRHRPWLVTRVKARAAAPTLHCVLPHKQLSQRAAPPAEGRRVGSPRAIHG